MPLPNFTIKCAIDNREITVVVFIDFSKGFDTLDHNMLLEKLDHYGIRGLALNWFGSYLSNRQQYVEFNSCLLYTSPSPRDGLLSRMPSSA